MLTASSHFMLIDIDTEVAERAAWLRANYRLRTPDALQISAALTTGCQAFLTNDKELRRVTETRILIVDELL
ncbi:MAG: PIN domain-containing protein [Chloroflexi bacterium]|nr:PIN domain-containing protein [Chloroflexota bacterium]